MDKPDLNQTGASAPGQQAPAQEPQLRTFDQDTISKLNAIGVDHTNAEQLKTAGFEPYVEGGQAPPAAAPIDTPATAEPGPQTPPAATPPAVEPGAQTPPAAESAHNVDHGFFGGKQNLGNNTPAAVPELKGLDDVNGFIKTQLEAQGVNNLTELISNFSKNQEAIDSLKVIEGEYNKTVSSFDNMPPELLKAMQMAEKGEDWKGFMNSSPSIDFSSKAENLSKEDLLKTYYGDQFSSEDLDAADPDSVNHDPNMERMVNLAHKEAISKFNTDKQSRTLTMEQARDNALKNKESFTSAVKDSTQSIKEFMPTVSDEYLNSLEQDFLSNGKDLVFSNPDGSLRGDAMLNYALAKDGKDIFQQMQKVIEEQAQTNANLELLVKKNKEVPAASGAAPISQGNEIRPEVVDYIERLTGQKVSES